MRIIRKIKFISSFLVSLVVAFYGLAIQVYAARNPGPPIPPGRISCYPDWIGDPPSVGAYLECVIPTIWTAVKVILIAIAIILTMILIFKWVTNMYNPKVLEEMPSRAKYLLFFVIIIVGGGSALNILLRFLGFGGFDPWFDLFNEMLSKLR